MGGGGGKSRRVLAKFNLTIKLEGRERRCEEPSGTVLLDEIAVGLLVGESDLCYTRTRDG